METQIQSLHFDVDETLFNFILDKTNHLEKFYTHIQDCTVILKLDKDSENKDKVVEIIVNVTGKRLFATDRAETFESATILCIDEIKAQLAKHKTFLHRHAKDKLAEPDSI